ncbi:MAG: hypothetical protein CL797_02110 [Chromatiales bacterium]|jgi:hypothetical protein|nr:hypothetical protein [Chromatiales bacterium]MDP6435705.1 hypothetical protein [Gammaproteobacteria bacterium]
MPISTSRRRISRAYKDFARHGSVPGYEQMPLLTRLSLNLRALLAFTGSEECLRMLVCITVWQLVAYILIWTFDPGRRLAAVISLLCCLWVWPWLASARSRHINRLLGDRWQP